MDARELVTIYARTVMPQMRDLGAVAKHNPADAESVRQLLNKHKPSSNTVSAIIESDARVIVELTVAGVASPVTARNVLECLKAFANAREAVILATGGQRNKFPRGLLMETNWAELAASFDQ